LDHTQSQLDNVKSELAEGFDIIDPDLSAFALPIAALVSSMPISGTPQAGDVATFEANLDTARTYLKSKRDSATPSILTRFIVQPIFSLRLSLNQSWGNLTGRGEHEDNPQTSAPTQLWLDQFLGRSGVGIVSPITLFGLDTATQARTLLESFFTKVTNITLTPQPQTSSATMTVNEQAYIKGNTGAPQLAEFYADPQSSYTNHKKVMDAYIEPGRLAASKNINEVKQRAYYEADRLLGDYGKRNNASKEALLHDFINLYLGKMEESIAEGSVKTTGPGSISIADIQSMLIEEIHLLAYQDYVDTENLLGDHGLRHLFEHNTKVTFDILDKLKKQGKDIKAIDYLSAIEIQVRHDLGYTNPLVREGINASRFGIDNGHNVLSGKYFRGQLENNSNHPLSRLFNPKQIATIHEAILKHDIAPINLSSSDIKDLILSAVTIADNTHAFETKLPELMYGYPESLKVMRILKAIGETIPKDDPQYQPLIDQVKQVLIDSIQNNPDWGPDDKTALTIAATQLNPQQWSFNVGRISGNNPTFALNDDGSFTIEVIGSETHRHITQLFNQQEYLQLAKFIADLTKENKKDVLAKMNANQTEFGNGQITIKVVTSPQELSTGKTDYQNAIEKLLLGDTALQTYNNADNKLAQDQAYQEALLVASPGNTSIQAETTAIKSKRRKLFDDYLDKI
jgi:hypothetical protein